MPRQADHPGLKAEPLAAELGPQADLAGGLQQRRLDLEVAEGMAALAAFGRQAV